ncbi:DUF2939 domain-containing protein [Pectinatus frisingensis]|jgi:hypothetical protein|uniref:DUF2939 domain-containing protein n=1 Tax=Pectinatus frisingensis TaxID=865 RepID=UPI0015F64E37|nr:DUF2939 domain-containing protein [Pectinatus frisingensis]
MKRIVSNFKIKAAIAGIIVILISCGTLYWYFGYYVKTPDYAIKKIGTSIAEHDVKTFNKYVDRKALLDDLADSVTESIVHADQQSVDGTGFAMQEYSSIFKKAFIKGFDEALTDYVTYGEVAVKQNSDDQSTGTSDYADLLQTSGLNNLTYNSYKLVSIDKQTKKALLEVDVVQNEIDEPFAFNVTMEQQADGHWEMVKVENFSDFLKLLNEKRRQEMLSYVSKTDALMTEHDKTFKNIDGQLQDIKDTGSIGNNDVRNNLKNIINDNMLPHWHMLKEALAAVSVPKSAETLQRLRLKICDLYIAYYENYVKWLDDKEIKSLREAESNLKRAKTLETNETDLVNIIKRDLAK